VPAAAGRDNEASDFVSRRNATTLGPARLSAVSQRCAQGRSERPSRPSRVPPNTGIVTCQLRFAPDVRRIMRRGTPRVATLRRSAPGIYATVEVGNSRHDLPSSSVRQVAKHTSIGKSARRRQ